MTEDVATTSEPTTPDRKPLYRVFAMMLILATTFVTLKLTGVLDQLDAETIRDAVQSAGVWGILVFLVSFSIGLFVHVPGLVFVGAAVIAWGQFWGFWMGLCGGVVALQVSFHIVRSVGGNALTTIEKPWLKRGLEQLDKRPIATIAAARIALIFSWPLTYALAMSQVRPRQYLIGSVIGLIVPLLGAAIFFEWLVQEGFI